MQGRPNDRIKYRSPVTEILSMTSAGRNASPPPLIKPLSPAHISHFRQRNLDFAFQDHRNSAPPGVSTSHPLSVNAIKECFENHNSNCKNKGSPVTALKDEIDKHFNGLTLEGLPLEAGLSENYLYPVSHTKQAEKEKVLTYFLFCFLFYFCFYLKFSFFPFQLFLFWHDYSLLLSPYLLMFV